MVRVKPGFTWLTSNCTGMYCPTLITIENKWVLRRVFGWPAEVEDLRGGPSARPKLWFTWFWCYWVKDPYRKIVKNVKRH